MKKSIFLAVTLIAICLFTASIYSQTTTYGLINGSGMIITNVNLSQPGLNSWGANINTGKIAADESIKFTHSPEANGCVVDVRYSGEDGKYYYIQNFDLCGPTSVVLLNPFIKSDDKVKTEGKTEETGKVKQSEDKSLETITNTNQPVDSKSNEGNTFKDNSTETKTDPNINGDVKSFDSVPTDSKTPESKPVDGVPTDSKPVDSKPTEDKK